MSETGTIERLRGYRKTYWAMLVSSTLSLLASLVLSYDAIKLAEAPTNKLSCDLNAVISCGKVAKSWQSSLLGFPNSFLGLMLEPVIITVAIAGLGLVAFPRLFMRVAHIGYGLGLLFAFWLLSQSLFVIHALCPWCLLVTISTVTVFSTITRISLMENIWNFSESRHQQIVDLLNRGWGRLIYTVTYAVLILAIYFKYGQDLLS
ncbi:unannotated protein [freshwater metagenome]|uniref:Unannotated protein n=1 Tax=freshwater metagenome TaxID=449393 RepID=A0A6J7ESR6_9ZZZZ|nr:vitamin K epoxide reductase [Actinomycetota bacterium]